MLLLSLLKALVLFGLIHSSCQDLVWENLSLVAPQQRRQNAAIGYHEASDFVFIFGGEKEDNGQPLSDVFQFDMAAKNWATKGVKIVDPQPKARYAMVYGSREDFMYIAMGHGIDSATNNDAYYNDLWRFNFNTKQWQELSGDMAPKVRYSAGGGIHANATNFFITHGFNDDNSFSDLFTYDTESGGWEREFAGTSSYNPAYPHARHQHSTAVLSKNKLLLFGGCLSGQGTGGPCPSDDSWVFDLSSKTWTEVNRCAAPKIYSAMAALPKGTSTKVRVILWGGNSDSRTTLVSDADNNDEVSVFIEEDEQWVMKKTKALNDKFPDAREGHAMVSTKYGIVVFGGKRLSDGQFLSDLWLLRGTSEDADSSADGRDCGRQYFNIIMLHGIFMFLGWSVFMVMGIFTARYFTFLHPLWFKLHVVFQVFGLFLILAGTICGIVSVPSHQHFKFVHSIFGYIIFVFVVQQPFNAILRPQAIEHGYNCCRTCWEVWHKWSGFVVILCSLVNITLGLFMAVPPMLVWALWLAYLAMWLVIFVVAEATKKPLYKRLARNAKKPVVYDATNPYRISKGQASTVF